MPLKAKFLIFVKLKFVVRRLIYLQKMRFRAHPNYIITSCIILYYIIITSTFYVQFMIYQNR